METFIVSSPSEMPPELLFVSSVMLSFLEALMELISPAGFAGVTELTSGAGKASLPSRPPPDSAVYDGILMHDERFNVDRPSDTVQSM